MTKYVKMDEGVCVCVCLSVCLSVSNFCLIFFKLGHKVA